jgi:hypothetical protein
VDIWAIGLVAFEVLTGETPFRGADDRATIWNVANLEVRSLSKLRPDLPESLTDLIHACLEKERELRPVRCSAVARELREAAERFGHDASADIASCVTRLFSAEAASSRDKVARVLAGEKITTPLAAPEPPRRPSHAPTAVGGARKKQSRKVAKPKKRRPRVGLWLVLAVLVGLAIGAAVAWWLDGMRWPPSLPLPETEPASDVGSESGASAPAESSATASEAEPETAPSAVERAETETNAAETATSETEPSASPAEAVEGSVAAPSASDEAAATAEASDPASSSGESDATTATDARETKRAARERARRARARRLARQRAM